MDYMLKGWWVRWGGGINVTLRLSFGTWNRWQAPIPPAM